jgi:ADP-ribose pyrophosphatase
MNGSHLENVPAPIVRTREVEVFANRFGRLFNDEVLSPSGAAGRYLRWQWASPGVVVVPHGPGGFALVPAYRYPTGASALEFPRGAGEPGEALQDAAARELREETGLVPTSMQYLGLLHADSGLIESTAHVYLAKVVPALGGEAAPEVMESVADPVWVSEADLRQMMRDGKVTCGITLAAFALLLAHTPGPALPEHTATT